MDARGRAAGGEGAGQAQGHGALARALARAARDARLQRGQGAMKAFTGGVRTLGAAGLALSSWALVAAAAPSPFEADTAKHALIVVDALVQRKSLLATQESPILA